MNITALSQLKQLGVINVEVSEASFNTLKNEVSEVFSDRTNVLVEDKGSEVSLLIFGVTVFYKKSTH